MIKYQDRKEIREEKSVTPVPKDPAAFSGLLGNQAFTWHTDIYLGKTLRLAMYVVANACPPSTHSIRSKDPKLEARLDYITKCFSHMVLNPVSMNSESQEGDKVKSRNCMIQTHDFQIASLNEE